MPSKEVMTGEKDPAKPRLSYIIDMFVASDCCFVVCHVVFAIWECGASCAVLAPTLFGHSKTQLIFGTGGAGTNRGE